MSAELDLPDFAGARRVPSLKATDKDSVDHCYPPSASREHQTISDLVVRFRLLRFRKRAAIALGRTRPNRLR